jgi:long-chain acyl-CoA synthetase
MVETLSQLFLHTIKSYPKDDLMLHKREGRYMQISTEEFGSAVKHFSLKLRDLGFKAGEKLIILSETRPEWVMTDMACQCSGGITVPIYPTLMPEQIKYIIDNSDAKIVVCSTQELWQKVEAVKTDLTKVEYFVSFEPVAHEEVQSFEQMLEQGKTIHEKNPELFEEAALAVKPEDIASIIYTSGTTGVPKGVMLTHANFISNAKTAASIIEILERETSLSFCPLSHIMERIVTYVYLHQGCTIAYAESIDTVAANLVEVKPNFMVSPPRVFERIYAGVLDNVLASSPLKRKIFYWALEVGRECSKKKLSGQPISWGLQRKRNLAHKLVYSKIIERTGGRVRFFVSGGAALAKEIAEFFHALGMVVLEAYGLTETSPIISINTFENLKFGTVGKPIPGVEVRIAEDGEILTKGPHVMKGYYKKEAETAEVFEGDWFFTGDIGHLDEEGFLVITDRKKDIIVTAGGKNVAPQQIENLLKTNPYISNAVVVGDKRKFISALIVPNLPKLESYAGDHNIPFESGSDLIKNEKILEFLLAEVDKSTPDLARFEKVKKIALLERDFELDKGEITPSLKVKRNIVEGKYKDLIDSLYET